MALEYRVDGRTRLIEKITMISMTKGAEAKIDAGSIFVPAGTVLSGEAGRNARSNIRQRGCGLANLRPAFTLRDRVNSVTFELFFLFGKLNFSPFFDVTNYFHG